MNPIGNLYVTLRSRMCGVLPQFCMRQLCGIWTCRNSISISIKDHIKHEVTNSKTQIVVVISLSQHSGPEYLKSWPKFKVQLTVYL